MRLEWRRIVASNPESSASRSTSYRLVAAADRTSCEALHDGAREPAASMPPGLHCLSARCVWFLCTAPETAGQPRSAMGAPCLFCGVARRAYAETSIQDEKTRSAGCKSPSGNNRRTASRKSLEASTPAYVSDWNTQNCSFLS
jgi:hypothetical protein